MNTDIGFLNSIQPPIKWKIVINLSITSTQGICVQVIY